MAKAKPRDSDATQRKRRTAARSELPPPDGAARAGGPNRKDLTRKQFETELLKLQRELVIMQEYVKAKGLRIVVIFEGRDAAGKGGVIKRTPSGRIPVSAVSSRSPRRPSARNRNGTSSATCRTFPPPGRSSCSIARGTTAPASSA
jgi:polyphosphate kinase 2 (PPK2 family)